MLLAAFVVMVVLPVCFDLLSGCDYYLWNASGGKEQISENTA